MVPKMPQSGLLNVNKPSGITSFQVIKVVRKILNMKRVGHCGTLDPMARGVLLVLFGSATSYSNQLMAGEKTYLAEMQLGIKTDTGDITGSVIEKVKPPRLDKETFLETFHHFVGEIEQVPPMVSAVKWKGRKLYEYARRGLVVDRPARKIKIFSLELLDMKGPVAGFRLVCSKGTYVRQLVEDMGASLGIPATLKSLIREKSGRFSLDESLDWDRMVKMSRNKLISKSLSPEAFLS